MDLRDNKKASFKLRTAVEKVGRAGSGGRLGSSYTYLAPAFSVVHTGVRNTTTRCRSDALAAAAPFAGCSGASRTH